MPRGLIPALCCLLLAACAGNSLFHPYPAQMAPVSQALNQNQPARALALLEPGLDGNDALLYAQEAGRIAALGGDPAASQAYYDQAMAEYSQYDWKAMLSLSDMTAQVGGATVSDNLIPYHGQAYERVMVHQQQALNYLWQGNLEGALVEVRRADQAQRLALAAYEDSLASTKALNNAAVNAELTRLDREAGLAPNSFLNAYVLFTNATLYEAVGQPDDALIDLRKALQIVPEHPVLRREVVRLACQLNIDCEGARRQFGTDRQPGRDEGKLVVLVEVGQIPARQSITVPFAWEGFYQQVALPTYPSAGPPPLPLVLNGLAITTEPVTDFSAMAARALHEQYPFILIRQGIRLTTKHNANRWAERQGGDWAALSMELFNAFTEQPDRRSWLTLPRQAQVWAGHLPAGPRQFQLDGQPVELALEPGRTTLVWIARQNGLTRIQTKLI